MALMSSGGGLGNGKLELATAIAEDVLFGKTFYSGDKELKTGLIPDYGYEPLAKSVGIYNPGDGNRVYLYLQNADTDQQNLGGHVTRSICASANAVLNTLHNGKEIKTRYAVCFMSGSSSDLHSSIVAFKLNWDGGIEGASCIRLTSGAKSAFGVFTFSAGDDSRFSIYNSITLKVIGRLSVLQGNSSSSVGPSSGTTINAGSTNTYYTPGGQSGRTVGLIIYEEI